MIERIESSLTTFKRLGFKPGLNVLLARKSPGATDRQTRNGAGLRGAARDEAPAISRLIKRDEYTAIEREELRWPYLARLSRTKTWASRS